MILSVHVRTTTGSAEQGGRGGSVSGGYSADTGNAMSDGRAGARVDGQASD